MSTKKWFKSIVSALSAGVMFLTSMPAFASIDGYSTDTSISGWSFLSNMSDSHVYTKDQTEGALSGKSIKIVNLTPYTNGNWCVFTTSLNGLKAGKTYKLEFDAKVKNGTRSLIKIDSTEVAELTAAGTNFGWKHFVLSYTETENTSRTLGLSCENSFDALWFDNVKFYAEDTPAVNMISNGTFDNDTSAETESGITSGTEGVGAGILIPSRKTVNVDGDISDWNDIAPVSIGRKQVFAGNGTAADITPELRYAFDEQNLYVAIVVKDATHVPADDSVYWEGDGVQMAFAPYDKPGQINEIGVTCKDESGNLYKTDTKFNAAVSRENNVTTYEMAIPFENYFDNGRPDAIAFNALVNQNDGSGRSFCMEITPGISLTKDASVFKTMVMGSELGALSYFVAVPEQAVTQENATGSVFLINNTNLPKIVKISYENASGNENVLVWPGKNVVEKFNFTIPDGSPYELKLNLTCDADSVSVSKTVKSVFDYVNNYSDFRARVEGYIAELKELIMRCNEKNINPQYEIASYAMICRYLDLADYYVQNNFYTTLEEFDRVFEEEYKNSKEAMEAYIAGTRTPLEVPDYIVDDGFEIDGETLYATTDTNGVRERRPIFFGGYGPWSNSVDEAPFLSNLGFNTYQIEFSMNSTLSAFNLPYWIAESYGPTHYDESKIKLEITDEEKVSGNYSLKFSNPDDWVFNRFTLVRQTVEVEPGATYEYGMKVKAMATDGWRNWFQVGSDIRRSAGAGSDWTDYTGEFTVGEGDTTADFVLGVESRADRVYYDDLYIKKKGTEENLLKNGGFEIADKPESEKTEFDKEAEALGLYFSQRTEAEMRSYFKKAEECGYMVDVILAPQYIGSMVYDLDPSMKLTDPPQFLPFQLNNETLLKVQGMWARFIASVAKEYKSVRSISVTNEPSVFAYREKSYLPYWHEYLKNVHGSIEKLNEAYNSDYKSFDEVPMPETMKESTPLYYDYRCFNDSLSNDYHRYICDEIRKVAPDIKLNAKVMGYFTNRDHNNFSNGQDWELMSEYMDLNGNDSLSWYGDREILLFEQMAWYDFLTSVKSAPVWNTEDHILLDQSKLFYDGLAHKFVGATIWDGGVHGRGTSIQWLWNLSESDTAWNNSEWQSTNAVYRPADVMESSRAIMDLNRLSYEVAALQKEKAKIGILYSRTSHGYVENIMETTLDAYKECIWSGQKVDFVTDSNPEKMQDYQLLIVPECTNVAQDVIDNIKQYIANGGKVLLTTEHALKYNEYNKEHNSQDIEYIYNNSDKTSSVREKIKEMGLSEVILTDADTGEQLDTVEWSYTEYNGNIIVNVVDYGTCTRECEGDTRNIKITYKGENIVNFKELRSDKQYENNITIKPYEPVLLQFKK